MGLVKFKSSSSIRKEEEERQQGKGMQNAFTDEHQNGSYSESWDDEAIDDRSNHFHRIPQAAAILSLTALDNGQSVQARCSKCKLICMR